MFPKITIITPSFNQGKFLEQTILSVLSQNYPNLEYIVIDGGSSDNSIEIIKKYSQKLAYWVSEPDFGQSHAINKGLKIATGVFFAWLNSDDYYAPNALYNLANSIQNFPHANIICGKTLIIDEAGNGLRTTSGVMKYSNLSSALGNPVINQPETFFKTSILKKTGLLNESLRYNMDKDLLLKYFLHFGINNIEYCPHILANFRHHAQSKTISEVGKFAVERDKMMLGMMDALGLSTEAECLSKELDIKPISFQMNLEAPKISDAWLHYYYLLKADEAFVNKNFNQMRFFLTKINQIKVLSKLRLYLSLKLKL